MRYPGSCSCFPMKVAACPPALAHQPKTVTLKQDMCAFVYFAPRYLRWTPETMMRGIDARSMQKESKK